MKILITGAGGRLGAALMREYQRKFEVTGFNHAQLDLSNPDQIRERIGTASFDVLINAAAFTSVDLCETQRNQAFQINAEAPRLLAEICRDKDAKLIHFSTDYVFDGKKRAPYTEEDEANPISVYGESKLAGEKNVLAAEGPHLVVRVSWVFGPDRPSFIDGLIKRAQENDQVDAIADKFSTPTYTLDIAEMLGRILDGWCRRAFAPDGLGAGRLHFRHGHPCSMLSGDEKGVRTRNGIRHHDSRRELRGCGRRIDRAGAFLHRARRPHEMGLPAGRSASGRPRLSRPGVAPGHR